MSSVLSTLHLKSTTYRIHFNGFSVHFAGVFLIHSSAVSLGLLIIHRAVIAEENISCVDNLPYPTLSFHCNVFAQRYSISKFHQLNKFFLGTRRSVNNDCTFRTRSMEVGQLLEGNLITKPT